MPQFFAMLKLALGEPPDASALFKKYERRTRALSSQSYITSGAKASVFAAYPTAVWMASGSAPVAVGPGYPITDSPGKSEGFTVAAREKLKSSALLFCSNYNLTACRWIDV